MIKPRMMFAHMRSAQAYSLASYAERLRVGAVIVNQLTDQPVAIGWNGTAPGAPNVCEVEQDGQLVSVGVIHAEINALQRLKDTDVDNLVLFVTHSPCPDCVNAIIESGIKTVCYDAPYRITTGLRTLLNAGVKITRVTEYLIKDITIEFLDEQDEWNKRDLI